MPEIEIIHNYYPALYTVLNRCAPIVLTAKSTNFPTGIALDYEWTLESYYD